MKIGSIQVGIGHAPVVIAEMSGNHNQSIDRALEIVRRRIVYRRNIVHQHHHHYNNRNKKKWKKKTTSEICNHQLMEKK